MRVEMVALGLPATLLLALSLALGEARLEAAWRRIEGHAGGLAARPALVLGGLLALWAILFVVEAPIAVDRFDPLSVGGLTLLVGLASVLPLGALVLLVFGAASAVRTPRLLLLPLWLFVLAKLYYSASHSATAPFEVLRYATMLVPALLVTALFGWRELQALLERNGASPRSRAIAVTVIALSFGSWSTTELAFLAEPMKHNAPAPAPYVTVQRDQQHAVRHLLSVVDRYPDCVLVARAVPRGTVATEEFRERGIRTWTAVALGKPLARAMHLELQGASLEELVARVPKGCVLYYRGIDCNLTASAGACDDDVRGRALLEEQHLRAARYYTHVQMAPAVRLAVYALRR